MTKLIQLVQRFIIGVAIGLVLYGLVRSLVFLGVSLAVCVGLYLCYREQCHRAVLAFTRGGEVHD